MAGGSSLRVVLGIRERERRLEKPEVSAFGHRCGNGVVANFRVLPFPVTVGTP